MSEQKQIITDEMCIAKWQQLLKVFKKIIENNPSPENVKEKLEALKETAIRSVELTPRQIEGIVARCDNYLKGEYGNTKTPDNYGHGKTIPPTNGKAA